MAEQAAAAKPLVDLHEQVALVTGASSGIGEAITDVLARRGTHVAMFARRTDRLRVQVERLAQKGEGEHHGETLAITGDVRNSDDVSAAVRQTLERWGRLDILVANAGFGYRKSVVEGDIQRWKDM